MAKHRKDVPRFGRREQEFFVTLSIQPADKSDEPGTGYADGSRITWDQLDSWLHLNLESFPRLAKSYLKKNGLMR